MSEEEQTQATDWKANLPEEIRDNPSLKDVKTIEDLAKTHINAQGMLGNSIRVPGPEAGQEDKDAFHKTLMERVPGLMPAPDEDNEEAQKALWKRLGVPEMAEGYEFPEGVSGLDELRDYASSAGLTKKQFQTLAKAMGEKAESSSATARQEKEQAQKDLKYEWGVTYEDRMAEIKSLMASTNAPKGLQAAFNENDVDADTLKWMAGLAKSMGVEGQNIPDDPGGSTRVTPAEAQARINEIMGDRDGPFWNASDPRHQEFKDKVLDYQRAASTGS